MPDHDSLPDISPFQEIEVWCTFTRRWVPGFWFDGLEPDGFIRLRRGVDQSVLPGPVPPTSVRRSQPHSSEVIDLRDRRVESARPRPALVRGSDDPKFLRPQEATVE